MDAIVNASYFKLNRNLSDDKLDALRSFLEERIKSGKAKTYKGFIIDWEALSLKINLDCLNCSKLFDQVCCGGSPREFLDEEYAVVSENLYDIVHGRFTEEQISDMLTKGLFRKTPAGYATRGFDWGCAFLMTTESGERLCAIKNWCIANDFDIVGICPSSCIMFPVDAIEFECANGERHCYITSTRLAEYTRQFARWGPRAGKGMPCQMDGEVPLIYAGKIFKKSGYVPVYEEFEPLLPKWFGADVARQINKLCGGR